MPKVVLPIGDMHVGCMGAIMPPEVVEYPDTPSKRKYHYPTDTQKELYKLWEQMCDDYPQPDVLILNGDLVDGKNYKESGMGCWTTEMLTQCEAACELLGMLKPRKIIGTTGSAYHSEKNPNADEIITKALGGEFKGGYGVVDVNGCRFYAQHKVGVSKSTWQYRGTPIGRAIVLANLAGGAYGHLDVILKSHAHYFYYVGTSNQLGMILPCWKAHDDFGDTNVEFVDPCIGYVVFEVNDDGDYIWTITKKHFKQSVLNPDVIV